MDYWLTLTALLPTWGSQWFVSGMAELLSGRRAYVTGAADNTWVLSWGLGEWPGSQRERQRGHHSPLRQPSVGWEGQLTAGTEDTSLFGSPLDGLWRKQFHTLIMECMASRLRCYLHSTPGETTEYSHHPLLLTNEQVEFKGIVFWRGAQQAPFSSLTEKTSAN